MVPAPDEDSAGIDNKSSEMQFMSESTDWYACVCGAEYRKPSAALRCCSEYAEGTQ